MSNIFEIFLITPFLFGVFLYCIPRRMEKNVHVISLMISIFYLFINSFFVSEFDSLGINIYSFNIEHLFLGSSYKITGPSLVFTITSSFILFFLSIMGMFFTEYINKKHYAVLVMLLGCINNTAFSNNILYLLMFIMVSHIVLYLASYGRSEKNNIGIDREFSVLSCLSIVSLLFALFICGKYVNSGELVAIIDSSIFENIELSLLKDSIYPSSMFWLVFISFISTLPIFPVHRLFKRSLSLEKPFFFIFTIIGAVNLSLLGIVKYLVPIYSSYILRYQDIFLFVLCIGALSFALINLRCKKLHETLFYSILWSITMQLIGFTLLKKATIESSISLIVVNTVNYCFIIFSLLFMKKNDISHSLESSLCGDKIRKSFLIFLVLMFSSIVFLPPLSGAYYGLTIIYGSISHSMILGLVILLSFLIFISKFLSIILHYWMSHRASSSIVYMKSESSLYIVGLFLFSISLAIGLFPQYLSVFFN